MEFSWQEGNQIDLLINGEEYFPRVFECIRNARKEVLLETFIIFNDKVGIALKDALLEAASHNARIEIIVDGYGTANLPDDYISELVNAGIKLRVFDPQPKLLGMRTNLFRRLHRKIVVVDNEVAFIGGINFGADHLADYGPEAKQDYAVVLTGPAVKDLRRASCTLLREYAGVTDLPAITPVTTLSGDARALLCVRDNRKHKDDIEKQYLQALRSAKHRVVIANAYFLPSYRLIRQLRITARRGVNVILILQGKPDMPWVQTLTVLVYNYLLRHGVAIHEFCRGPLHGKVALVDEEWSTVGSSNLDPLSLSLNLEANLIIRDKTFNHLLHEHLTSLLDTDCTKVTSSEAVRGNWWRAPLTMVGFHILRHFPSVTGLLPAHTQKIEPMTVDDVEPGTTTATQVETETGPGPETETGTGTGTGPEPGQYAMQRQEGTERTHESGGHPH